MKKRLIPTTVRLPRFTGACLTALLLLAGRSAADAANATWTGSGANAFWTTPGNWAAGVPNSDDALIFGASSQLAPDNNFPADTSFSGFTFDANATSSYTLAGNSVALIGPVENTSSALHTIGLPLVITNAVTFNTVSNLDTTVGDLAVSGGIGGAGSLVKLGGGTLTLISATHTGGTTVSNGLLVVSNNIGNVTMSGGAMKMNFRAYYVNPTIAFTADASVGIDLLDNTEPRGVDYAGNIGAVGYKWTKTGEGIFRMVGGGAFVSAIDVAEGTLANNGGSAMPFTRWGTTNVITVANGATLRADDGGICPNPIVLMGGDGTSAGSYTHQGALVSGLRNANQGTPYVTNNIFTNTITLVSDTTIGSQFGNMIISGNITGAGSLTKIGNNPLTLAASNSYAGNTVITSGNLILGADYALPTGTLLDLTTNTLDLGGFSSAVKNVVIDIYNPGAQVFSSGAGNATLTFGSDNNDLTLATPLQNTGSGALGFVKQGTGTASLMSPLSNYRGGIAVQGGTFDTTIPVGAATNGPISVANGAKLTVRVANYGTSFKPSAMTIGAVSGASTVDVDLGTYGNASGGIFNVTNGTGVLTANGTNTVDVLGDSGAMGVGQFPIFRYTTRAGTGSFVIGTLPANIVATIVTNASGKSIDLKVTSAPVTKWVGNVNNLWDIGTTIISCPE